MTATTVTAWATYLVNPNAGADKFYRAFQIDRYVIFQHGRGHRSAGGGRITVKAFPTAAQAQAACAAKIAEKTRAGYAHPAARDAFPIDPTFLSPGTHIDDRTAPYLIDAWVRHRRAQGMTPTPRPPGNAQPPQPPTPTPPVDPTQELPLLADARAALTLAIDDPAAAATRYALLRERHHTAEARLAETGGLLEAIALILFATE